MEKLRAKSNQYRSFFESSKTLRLTMLEKRYPIDNIERSHLQKCLDTLQQNIKVTTHQAMIERLESVTRQLGLKFVTGPSGLDLFISSDMFYLEVVLEMNGGVKDVKIHHEGHGEQQSCDELVACLTRRDFADFTAQLEGFASIYQINAEKKVKCKAYDALTSLETDLLTLASLHSYINDTLTMIHQSPVGYLEKRRGGHAMKLTFFVSPYDLLDPVTRTVRKLPTEGKLGFGQSVSVCMESSSAHKLQTAPLVTINRDNNWPCYAPLSPSNSLTVTGCFVLTLNKPMPLCLSLINSIQAVTQLECADVSRSHPILSLISQHISEGKADSANGRGLFVNVGDQHHCYLMTEGRGLDAVLVSSIPFTHPNHVPQIITYLRQQALFNAVVASCVRPNTKQDLESMIMLEVTPLSWQHLSISLEHPVEESMATVEIDLTSIDRVTCKVYTSGESGSTSSEYATTVFQRCLSIPVTMRSLIKQWNAQSQRMTNFYNGLGGSTGGSGQGGNQGGNDFTPDVKIKLEPGLSLVHQGGSFDDSPGGGFDSFSSGPMETSELSISQTSISFPDLQGKNFLGLLDTGSGGSGMASSERKKRKRRSGDISWRSDKDSSSNDSTPLGTPTSREPVELPTPTSSSGLEFSTLCDLENSTTCDKASDLDIEEVIIGNPPEIEDVEEILKGNIKKVKKSKDEKKSASDILFDLENKNLVPPSVSITPISSSSMTTHNFNSILSGMGLERRPGIEIIPISSAAPAPTQSSITITPISSKNVSEERSKDRKSSRSREDKARTDRKRKRKREDSPMGPPEKVPPKPDPLSKPVSVSIKPADSSSPSPSSPASGNIRKYSSSPTSSNQLVLVAKSSPSSASKSSKQSPKHSPAYGTSSPKNSLTSSPKHGTSSPKHQSSSSSGKPSLSTLKSAVSSPSKEKSKSKEGKDKDRKGFSSGHSSPKLKSSSVKIKQLDLTNIDVPQSLQTGGTTPPQTGDGGKSSSGQSRIKKNSLSAVIDKLKSAQSCGEGETIKEKKEKSGGGSSSSSSKSDVKASTTGNSGNNNNNSGSGGKPGENKTGEYMVKPSSDGMKITINKTRTKDSKAKSSSSSSSSGSGSPKTVSSNKPGASSSSSSSVRKTHTTSQKSSSPGLKSSSGSSSSSSASSTSSTSSSSSNSSSKRSGSLTSLLKTSGKGGSSPKTSSDQSRVREKPKSKSSSEKSVFSSSKTDAKKMSPLRDENDFKNQTLIVEGFIKQLDAKYHIPKLSARNSNQDDKKEKTSSEKSSDSPKERYQRSEDQKPKGTSSISVLSPKVSTKGTEGAETSNISIIPVKSTEDAGSTDDTLSSLKIELPISTMSFIEQQPPELINEEDYISRPLSSNLPCTVQEAAEMLLDFSAPGKGDKLMMLRNTPPPPPLPLPPLPPAFPGSPSVSVHIVKSPAPVGRDLPNMVIPSPHSPSSCITDDELMDEAVVGMGK